MTSLNTPSEDKSKDINIYKRSQPFRLRMEDGGEGCVATIVDGTVQLENFASGGGEMSIEIIYSIKPRQFDSVARYFAYPDGLTIEDLLHRIDMDLNGAKLWAACRDGLIPDIERFTWIS